MEVGSQWANISSTSRVSLEAARFSLNAFPATASKEVEIEAGL
jgi:hypothetical protein